MARQPKPWFWKARKAWFVTIDGQRHNLGADKKLAQDQFFQLMRQPKGVRVAPQSLVALVDSFLDWVHRNRAPDTYEWYRYRLQRFVEAYPDMRAGDLRPFHVQQWVDGYPELGTTSKRNYLRTVKRCYRWSTQQGYIDENPIAHLEVPSAERREILVSEAEYQRILEYSRDQSFTDLVEMTWETGCRPQELLRVECRHVDLQKSRWVFPASESKGKRSPRIIYLTEPAVSITKRLMRANPTGRFFRNSRGDEWTSDAVNCGFDRIRYRMGDDALKETGASISNNDLAEFVPTLRKNRTVKGVEREKSAAELRCEAKRKLKKKLINALVPRYSLYALRHSWATRALQSGLDGLTVAVLMGHSDPSTLARVYQHLSHDPQHLLKQARRAAG